MSPDSPRRINNGITGDIPPSHPTFDREALSDSAFIELLLFEIKELRAECDMKNKIIQDLRETHIARAEEREKPFSSCLDGIPQRSARRRLHHEDKKKVVSKTSDSTTDEIPESEPHPETVANSVPLSDNFKSDLSLALKKSKTPDEDSPAYTEMEEKEIKKKETNPGNSSLLEIGRTGKARNDDDELNEHTVESESNSNQSNIKVSPKSDGKQSTQLSERDVNNSDAKRFTNNSKAGSYNTRIKLPHTMMNSDSRTSLISTSNSISLSEREGTSSQNALFDRKETYSLIEGTLSANFSQATQNSSYDTQPMALPKTPVSSSQDSQITRTPAVSHGSSFQVLTSPDPQDDVVLFIKPEDFLTIKIEVISTLSFNPKKSEDFCCTLSINDRETEKGMWKVRKSYNQILAFDNEIRLVLETFGLPPLPEKSLITSTVPAKVDTRKLALQHYFNSIFLIPHIPKLVLGRICRYISLDFVNPLDDFKSGAKLEGFLIRRYKGLGTTWKTRWCQVDGPSLEIYDFPGGPMMEQIRLQGSQIGRQSTDNVAEEKGYRHAFLILECPKNKISSSTQKHFFCAESDKERDEWVNAMVEYTENDPTSNQDNTEKQDLRVPSKMLELLSVPNILTSAKDEDSQKEIKEVKKLRKRSLFPFRYKGQQLEPEEESVSQVDEDNGGQVSLETHLAAMNLSAGQFRPVFGKELAEALALSSKSLNGRLVPTICFRCLEFLSKTGAVYEEGIFRLSGSASTIRLIKDQFNKEYDVNLFEHHLSPDIHTVAGLFKTYLRELPENIFGNAAYNHLQLMFLNSNERLLRSQLVLKMRSFINERANVNQGNFDFCFTVFRLLSFVVSQSKTNLMSLKNICIVFVPTLRISLDVLSLCITDFECIFSNGEPLDDDKREILDLHIPSF